MLQFSSEEVRAALSAADCIKVMDSALRLEFHGAQQYLRTVTKLPTGNILGYMPAFLGEDYFGAKIITVFHTNMGTQYPSHQGSVILFDTAHGSMQCMADGNTITAIRTGAVSALATRELARADAGVLCLMGAGEQARSHLAAMREVRTLQEVRVWDMNFERALAFAGEQSEKYGIKITACKEAQRAVEGADIICTLTPSHTPVLEKAWVKKGAHINAVGACFKTDRELPSDLVAAGKFYCDSYDAVHAEAGDFLFPKEEGLIGDAHIIGTLGEVLEGHKPAREEDDEITIFEALGLAIEDVACAKFLLENAQGK